MWDVQPSHIYYIGDKPGAASLLGGTAGILFSAVGISYSVLVRPKIFNWKIDSTLKAGTKPDMLPFILPIDRPEVIAAVRGVIRCYSYRFGIIIGPSGTGKSYATRFVCNENPSWTLYHEIYEPECAAEELAKTAGFITTPGFFDTLLRLPFDLPFYKLKALGQKKAVSYVLDTVAKRAKYLIKKNNLKVTPCYIIDGADLVAKDNSDVFKAIVDRAKYWANQGVLRIILVSSEGHVMPLVESTSAPNRSTEIVEILDVDSKKAVDYLVKSGLSHALANRLSDLAGNRMIYLHNIASIYRDDKSMYKDIVINEDVFFDRMERYLKRFVQHALTATAVCGSAARLIVEALQKNGPMTESQMISTILPSLKKEFSEVFAQGKVVTKEQITLLENHVCAVITKLVEANLLRYKADKTLIWHSQIAKTEVIAFFA